jgi:predicted alpha/beta hydrolase family esterase
MKTAIIIHGMSDDKEEYLKMLSSENEECWHWLLWLKDELVKKNIISEVLIMPEAYNPEYNAWKEMFERLPLNEETILVGHSCGGGFIVRYLSENDVKVGKVVLVAPWIDPDKYLKTRMFNFEIDEKIVAKTKGITIFSSTNDMQEVQDSIKILKEKIKDIKVVEFINKGHFCYGDMKTCEFPELLEEVLKV